MQYTNKELIAGIAQRDMRIISRLITLSENMVTRSLKVQAQIFKQTGNAHIIGVTGSPGAGKSTLVDQLALQLKNSGNRVAILAVDPSSPFTGGAILGDRIRMTNIASDPNIYIRSLATRGALGGVSRATLDAIHILDAAAFDIIIVETVGVGQDEIDIARIADTCLVVMVPGMGDSVQAIKAGILEIADLFVINKADREGANALEKDLLMLLGLSELEKEAWRPKICQTISTTGEGVKQLLQACLLHKDWLENSEQGHARKFSIIRETIIKLANEEVMNKILFRNHKKLDTLTAKCLNKKMSPYTASLNLLKNL